VVILQYQTYYRLVFLIFYVEAKLKAFDLGKYKSNLNNFTIYHNIMYFNNSRYLSVNVVNSSVFFLNVDEETIHFFDKLFKRY